MALSDPPYSRTETPPAVKGAPVEELPYWLVNVPKSEWPSECPDYLVNANPKDRRILSTLDKNYKRQSWPEVQQIISQ